MIYSGSAVVDHHNTSGFGTADNPPMVAIYTASTGAGARPQSPYSTDSAATWSKFRDNGRGPPVHELPVQGVPGTTTARQKRYWVMVAVEAPFRP